MSELGQDIDAELFECFRHIRRTLRKGRSPGHMGPPASCRPGCGPEGNSAKPAFHREIVLTFLLRHNGIRQRALAEELHISPSTLSEMVNRLEEEHYLCRETDPSDRRALRLVLTEDGEKQAAVFEEERMRLVRHLFRNLEREEKKELIRLISKIIASDEKG